MSSPQSTIYICTGVNITKDYQHTIWFNDVRDQKVFFEGKVTKTFPHYTYLRKNWSLKVEASYDEARSWNYLYFRNIVNGKPYYYFINSIEYLSDHSVELFIEMDVMQTYMFDYELLPCFIDREHSETDEPGDNLVDEGLELGEFVYENGGTISLSDMSVLILSTINPYKSMINKVKTISASSYIDGVFSGIGLFKVNGSVNDITEMLQYLDDKGWSDCIISMWMYPTALINDSTSSELTEYVTGSKTLDATYSRPIKLDGYYPNNKKLLTYPYCFLYVTGNMGSSATYHYENFKHPNECSLRVVGSITPNSGTKVYPMQYKDTTHNFEEGLNGTTFPSCAWSQDVYKMWSAQNEARHKVGEDYARINAINSFVPLLQGSPAGAYSQYISANQEMSNLLAQKQDMSVQPPQSKGSSSVNINVANGFQGYEVKPKTIKYDQAWRIDDYFSMFGYKTLRVKVPNTHVRENWTYTKTVNCKIKGEIANDDKVKIQNIYNNGITFWADGDKVGEYNLGTKDHNPCL